MSAPAFPAHNHDHGRCIQSALKDAEEACRQRGLRLTAIRKQVLELVWAEHRPIGAYDILDRLKTEHGKAAPPTVYRALDFLLQAGLVHRLESLNAYVGCPSPDKDHPVQFLICRDCGTVAELHAAAVPRALANSAREVGFTVEHETVEAVGLCPQCSRKGTSA